MNNKYFAFLDLLGFSNYATKNVKGAVRLLNDYHDLLTIKLNDKIESPIAKYDNSALKEIATNNFVDSFNDFIPFSDSIFITAENPNLFLKQTSNFLLESFLYTSHVYKDGRNENNVTEVEIKEFGFNRESGLIESKRTENWYPVLFRGGISYGNLIPIEMTCIKNYSKVTIPNILGEVVVEAVNLEKTDKGPRLFCNKKFVDNLDDKTKHFIIPLNKSDLYEILWPMIIYIDSNNCKVEINSFMNLFIPALNLWKAFNHLDFGTHYYKLIKLIVLSTIKYFEYREYSTEAEKYISEKLKCYGLEQKINDLMKSIYI